jgi:hypothetical protein
MLWLFALFAQVQPIGKYSSPVVVTAVNPDGTTASDVDFTAYMGDTISVSSTIKGGDPFKVSFPDVSEPDIIQAKSGDLSAEAVYHGEHRLTLHLQPDRLCSIVGVLQGPHDGPLTNATVWLLRTGRSGSGLAVDAANTDAEGRYSFSSVFPCSSYKIFASYPGYQQSLSLPFAASSGEHIQRPDVTLWFQCGGGIVLGPDGKPASGAEVLMVHDNDQNPAHSWSSEMVKCDENGHFNFDADYPHLLDAIVARCGDLSTPAPVMYEGQDQITLRIVPGKLCSISGLLIDPRGHPVPNATVRLENDAIFNVLEHTVLTDDRGRYVFKDEFPNLTYYVSITAPGYTSTSSDTFQLHGRKAMEAPRLIVRKVG